MRSCRWFKIRTTLGIVQLVIGIVVLILAAGPIMHDLVESKIASSVHKTLQLDPATLSDSSLAQFLNSTSSVTYHIYNVTNLYEALTVPGTRLILQDVPIRTQRYLEKFDVVWTPDEDHVSYFQLPTIDIVPEDRWLLERPVVTINPFYFAVASQVQRQGLRARGFGLDAANFTQLNDQALHSGLIGSSIVPQLVNSFLDPTQPLLSQLRLALLPLYLLSSGVATNTSRLDAWSRGIPLLSLDDPSHYAGFELSQSLASTDPLSSARLLFNSTLPTSLVSKSGFAVWSSQLTSLTPSVVTSLVQGNALAGESDVRLILAWIVSLVSVNNAAYERAACDAFAGQLLDAFAQSSAMRAAIFPAAETDFLPVTWIQLGALQWATGWVLGLLRSPSLMLTTGMGTPAQTTIPAAFDFPSGINRYRATNPSTTFGPAGSNQGALWQLNPQLLVSYMSVDKSPSVAWPIVVPISVATRVLQAMVGSPLVYGSLVQSLGAVTHAYTEAMQASLDSEPGNVSLAIHTASQAARQVRFSMPLLQSLGIDDTNWYRVFCYLYNHMGALLTGTPQQWEKTSGVSPAASQLGLFAMQTAGQVLFGYTNTLGVPIPGISLSFPRPLDNNVTALQTRHRVALGGRATVQTAGKKDISRVGQWVAYEGVSAYSTRCQLKPVGCTEDWTIYPSTPGVVIAGLSDSLHFAPLQEDAVVPALSIYVTELAREVPLVFASDTSTKGISLRRYAFDSAMVVAGTNDAKNVWKNEKQWAQGGVPDGQVSLQRLNGGAPAMASLPYFGHTTDARVYGGVRCLSSSSSSSCGAYDSAAHGTYLDVEPLTGLTMRGAKRLQANMRISATSTFTSPVARTGGWNYVYNNLFPLGANSDDLYVPYYWVDQQALISDSDASKFRDQYAEAEHARTLSHTLGLVGLIGAPIGIFFAIVMLAHVCYDRRRLSATTQDVATTSSHAQFAK